MISVRRRRRFRTAVLVSAARLSAPQSTNAQKKKTSLQIEQLVLENRRLRREWQFHRSSSARQSLRHASRQLTKALQQKEVYANRAIVHI